MSEVEPIDLSTLPHLELIKYDENWLRAELAFLNEYYERALESYLVAPIETDTPQENQEATVTPVVCDVCETSLDELDSIPPSPSEFFKNIEVFTKAWEQYKTNVAEPFAIAMVCAKDEEGELDEKTTSELSIVRDFFACNFASYMDLCCSIGKIYLEKFSDFVIESESESEN